MGLRARLQAWASQDPLSGARSDPDPRLRGSSRGVDPNTEFLGHHSQGQPGNSSGPDLAIYRAVRWLTRRRG